MNGNSSALPTIFVIFGATGHLARTKLIPALQRLHEKRLLPPLFMVVGFSRQSLSDDAFREYLRTAVGVSRDFVQKFVYVQGFFEDRSGYKRLASRLGMKDKEWRTCANKLFYLAVPPLQYSTVFKQLAASKLTESCSPEEGWTRVIVEKPFGKDSRTAEALDVMLGKLFREEQVYRIDHYLGKETVQNILALRFSNSFLEPTWNKRFIEEIRIRFFEKEGVEGRGEFYDATGALRDVGQNHLLQLLALFAMDRPKAFDAENIRAARLAVLQALRMYRPKEIQSNVLRAQYAGYREEPEVRSDSTTETYFKAKAFLDLPKWRGMPFILEAGKKLPERRVDVTVRFRHISPCLCPPEGHSQNIFHYEIQPEEGLRLSLWVKRPGAGFVVEEKDFSFDYHRAYSRDLFVEAYEKLLLDTFSGNQTLFVSTGEIKASWKFIDPIVSAWKKEKTMPIIYMQGAVPDPKNQ